MWRFRVTSRGRLGNYQASGRSYYTESLFVGFAAEKEDENRRRRGEFGIAIHIFGEGPSTVTRFSLGITFDPYFKVENGDCWFWSGSM
jgi:hypothetical protein